MDSERIKHYLLDFQNRKFNMLDRELQIKESSKIQTVIGARRVGKTYLLFNKIKHLEQSGISREQMIYLNFESPLLSEISFKEINEIMELHWSLFPGAIKKKLYLFIDEPQVIPKWELAVRDIYDRYDCQIFLTGSSSKLLSKEIATSLRGRAVTNLLLPLSFQEFLRFKGFVFDLDRINTEIKSRLRNYFEEYLLQGGYPEIVLENNLFEKIKIVKDYFDLVVYKDIVERYNLKNTKIIRWLLGALVDSTAKELSINHLYNTIQSQGIKLSKNTLYSYFSVFEDSFFIFPVRKFDFSPRKSGFSIPKIYLNDVSFLNLFSLQERGRRLENLVFLHLLKQKTPLMQINYWKTKDNKEVDFIIREGKTVISAIQVCHDLSALETKNRELSALLSALDTFNLKKGVIITGEDDFREEKIDGKTILIIPAWKYLLG